MSNISILRQLSNNCSYLTRNSDKSKVSLNKTAKTAAPVTPLNPKKSQTVVYNSVRKTVPMNALQRKTALMKRS